MSFATFNRFEIEVPDHIVPACSHAGDCSADVAHYAPEVAKLNPEVYACTEKVRAELEEYGAWSEKELMDTEANWQRLVWVACGNIKEEQNER